MRPRTILILCAVVLFFAESHAADRFYVSATVNGRPALFAFDTGCPRSLLWRWGALRLGLTNRLGGDVNCDYSTEICTVSLGKSSRRMWFGVVDLPSAHQPREDGLLGWPALKNNILLLDAERGIITPLKKVPADAKRWGKIPLLADSPMLCLNVPRWQTGAKGAVLLVDTGNFGGVILPGDLWQSWRATNVNQPLTFELGANPVWGTLRWEESWAPSLSFGSLQLTDVPVLGESAHEAYPTNYEANVGMTALSRLDLIVDGPRGMVYFRPKTNAAPEYPHNGIGAVFGTIGPGTNLVARVLTNSPAYDAGVRDGDVLLSHLIDFTSVPVGKKVALKLRRGTNTFVSIVTSRRIIGPLGRNPTVILSYDSMTVAGNSKPKEITNDFSGLAIRLGGNSAFEYVARADHYSDQHQFTNALNDYREAILLDPKNDQAYNGVAWLEATAANRLLRNGREALRFARKACRLTRWKNPDWLDTLAAAYAERGDFKRAVKTEERALNMDDLSDSGRKELQGRLLLFKQARPFRDQSSSR